VIAAIQRGKITGTTALATRGVWNGLDSRIHVAVARNAHGAPLPLSMPLAAFTRPDFSTNGFVRHWRQEWHVDHTEPLWRASVIDSLLVAARSLSREQFIACAESALATGVLPRAALSALRASLPRAFQPTVDALRLDAASGLESTFGTRIAPVVRTLETQVAVPGLGARGGRGFVDFVLDGWLVVETDGDAFHDPAVDRTRNSILVRAGYRWHRFGFVQIVNEWPAVEATVLELLRFPPGGRSDSRGSKPPPL
jgi:hypothetical protein